MNTRSKDLELLLDENGIDLVDIISECLAHPECPPAVKLKACLDLLGYVYPKRKAVEVNLTGQMDLWTDCLREINEHRAQVGTNVVTFKK